MEKADENKYCFCCGGLVKGRSDKKFCCSQCKTIYSNLRRREEKRIYRTVDLQLHQNRKVLEKYYEKHGDEVYLNQKPLILEGFNSRYFTGILRTERPENKVYTVYDYGFEVNTDLEIKIFYYDKRFDTIRSWRCS